VDENFAASLASLVESIGQQLIPCLSAAQSDAALYARAIELLNGVYEQMFRFLAHENLEVSKEVIPLAEAFLDRVCTQQQH
jgi:hypothetical protein